MTTNMDRVVAILKANEGEWVSAITLMNVGGLLSWRTRLSEARRELHMQIDQKTEWLADGTRRSFYRYVQGTAQKGRMDADPNHALVG